MAYCVFTVLILTAMAVSSNGENVTYDGRSLIIDGRHVILFSGSIHYPRSTPEMWPSLIAKAKSGGINVIQTYVFWNLHEPQQGKFDFSGRKDIVKFIKDVQDQGLYVCLRIGPFIQAEWNYGGFPFWLHDIPDIVFRTDNEPFKYHMKRYAKMIVDLMKSNKFYASQGGPIILSQIENEYGMVEKAFEKGKSYVKWAADLTLDLKTGVPWLMCKQDDAPDPLINSCNGRRCGETFAGPNSPHKPSLWTENWTAFYRVFGREDIKKRSAEDLAYQVALFIAKKGSYVNYYMYHGGTNFGRTASAFALTSYYDEAPLDEYGLIRQPKWGHTKELHAAIRLCIKPLLEGKDKIMSLGEQQEAIVFKKSSNICAAFLVNKDDLNNAKVRFLNSTYELPPKSISILPDCTTVVYNTAKVNVQHSTRSMKPSRKFDSIEKWVQYKESIPKFDETVLRSDKILEQMNTTKDTSDYLWYTFRLEAKKKTQSMLDVWVFGHVLHAFVNGVLVGSAHGSSSEKNFALNNTISLNDGTNYVSLLSVMVGLPDSGPYLEKRYAGPRSVRVYGDDGVDITANNSWGYQVGLFGEKSRIYTDFGARKVRWSKYGSSTSQKLTWYKTFFDAPDGKEPVALNLASMGKGEVWVNGQSIGRYWVSFRTPQGTPSQTWYNVPRAFVKPTGNLLVILEEEYGYPLGITLDTVKITKVCGHVSESHPSPVFTWRGSNGKNRSKSSKKSLPGRRPKVMLSCPPRKQISKILFASFGNPVGDCGSYFIGSCHSNHTLDVVEKACKGKRFCSLAVRSKTFGNDPCVHEPKKSLLVDVECA